jgi:hypothetical protein
MIFVNLPTDIIKHIICFDKHFILRNNKLVSRIPKDDCRYKVLKYIIKEKTNEQLTTNINQYKCTYKMANLYNIPGRQEQNISNDMIEMRMCIGLDGALLYEIFIGKLKPKNIFQTKKSIYHKGELNGDEWEWDWIEYEYTRE